MFSEVSLIKRLPLAENWEKVVSLYTRCDLTCTSDKLVALSGIARAVQNETMDGYFAGLWKRDMEVQLCWYRLRRWDCAPRQTPTKLLLGLRHRLIVSCNMSRMRQVCLQISLFAYVFDVNLALCGSDPLGSSWRSSQACVREDASGRVQL
jgi:hypothetical protein